MNKSAKNQYRQGDVLIERVGSLPAKLTKVAREGGRVILAHGEVTGHAHVFDDVATEKFVAENGSEFFKVHGPEIRITLPIVRRWKEQVMVQHPQFGVIEFAESDVTVIGDQVSIDGEFGLLKHDEHTAHGVPAGLYKGGGAENKARQREYSPEAIRNVAD